MVGGQPLGDGPPDTPGTAVEGKAERGVRTPAEVVPAFDDVAQNAFEVHHRDAFSHPRGAHLAQVGRPNLHVIGSQEDTGQTGPEAPQDPVGKGDRVARHSVA